MISQRAARPSGSVEKLRQMSLSNLRGVDETRAPTDPYSVFSATNFTNNPDGSFSIRKPLLIKRNWTKIVKTLINNESTVAGKATDITVINVIPLYTGTDSFIFFKYTFEDHVREGFAIYDTKTDTAVSRCKLVWRDADDFKRSREIFGIYAKYYARPDYFIDLYSCNAVQTPTATVVGGCTVCLNSAIFSVDGVTFPMIDESLYYNTPEGQSQQVLRKRFIRIVQDENKYWNFEIVSPQVNVLGTEYKSNAALDAPFALRDEYNASTPAVRGILPYVYTTLDKGVPVPIEHPESTATSEVYLENREVRSDFGALGYSNLNESPSTWYELFDTDYYTLYGGIVFSAHVVDSIWINLTSRLYIKIHPKTTCTLVLKNFAFSGRLANMELSSMPTVMSVAITKSEHVFESLSEDVIECIVERVQSKIYDGLAIGTSLLMFGTYSFSVECSAQVSSLGSYRIADYTESVKNPRFRYATYLPYETVPTCVLKAFCNFPKEITDNESAPKYYATWLYTLDGKNWHDMLSGDVGEVNGYSDSILIQNVSEKPIESVESTKDSELPKQTVRYVPFKSDAKFQDLSRVDVLKFSKNFLENYFTNAVFRFKIVLVKGDGSSENPYEIETTYGQQDYVPAYSLDGEFAYSDLGNSACGKLVYHSGRLFSFGHPSLKNNVLVSETGSFVTPLENTIDLRATGDTIATAVSAWKDYLFISTPKALYLSAQVENGFLTKTVNAAIGIPVDDSECVSATLNGIVFKSDSKVYLMYPNVYAGDDSVTNVTEISKPVENYLFSYRPHDTYKPFAFSTESEYMLILPEYTCTKCLKYDYGTKLWNCLEFPIVIQRHVLYSLTNVVFFGQNLKGEFCEYYYDKTIAEAYGLKNSDEVSYGDILSESDSGVVQDIADALDGLQSSLTVTPIKFELDTGQKSDQILTKKQFVETKIVVATSAPSPTIDMDVIVHVDGDRNVTKNMSTDAAFWKAYDGGAVLNTTLTGLSNESDSRDVLRQLSIRYSGRGNSVRHILRGTCSSNFKLYETYIRYKLLNVK